MAAGSIRPTSPFDTAAGSGGQFPVQHAARTWTLLWMTMRQAGFRPMQLSMPCRSSPPVRVSFKHGTGSSLGGLISNPRFYEHLMGWPIGWTDPEAPVTGFAAWLLRSRGQLSKLISSANGEPANDR